MNEQKNDVSNKHQIVCDDILWKAYKNTESKGGLSIKDMILADLKRIVWLHAQGKWTRNVDTERQNTPACLPVEIEKTASDT